MFFYSLSPGAIGLDLLPKDDRCIITSFMCHEFMIKKKSCLNSLHGSLIGRERGSS